MAGFSENKQLLERKGGGLGFHSAIAGNSLLHPHVCDTKGGWAEEADSGLQASLILCSSITEESTLGDILKERMMLRSVYKQKTSTVEKESAQTLVNITNNTLALY